MILACVALSGATHSAPTARASLLDESTATDASANSPQRLRIDAVLATDPPLRVVGILESHSDVGLAVSTPDGVRDLTWEQLTPTSAYTIKSRLIDRERATDWLHLGRWAWSNGLDRQARSALAQARRLDRSLGSEVDAILASPIGSKHARTDAPATTTTPQTTSPGRPMAFLPATPEEQAAALERARKMQREINENLSIDLIELNSDHFIIFTDWDKREHTWLIEQCENAYRIVANQFNLSPRDNIFVGRLPMFMFSRQTDFIRYANEYDGVPAGESVAGYFSGRTDGLGHMAMWKPRPETSGDGARREAERRWGRVLVHEFVHAFVARYRTNGFIPRWLNEGLAEYIAHGVIPENNYFQIPREVAFAERDISILFDSNFMPGGGYYPVMMSMVKLLIEGKPKAFLPYFNDIKDGMDPEDALRKHYGVGHVDFEIAWRDWAKKLK